MVSELSAAARVQTLNDLFLAGLQAVNGRTAVARELESRKDIEPSLILSVGKAAVDMYRGCLPRFSGVPALIVTKDEPCTLAAPAAELLYSAHPVPDQRSVQAGKRLIEKLSSANSTDCLLLLVSGGASALVEVPVAGMTLDELRDFTRRGLATGVPIDELNAQRRSLSEIKGGKLLERFKGQAVIVLAISDVPADDIDVIGSGIGARGNYAGRYSSKIIASNKVLRGAVKAFAEARGIPVCYNKDAMNLDINEVAELVMEIVDDGPNGLYIFGGEPTVVLPENPGKGGRAQALALLLARAIEGRTDLTALVAGSDGNDGLSDAAGAIVDGASFTRIADAQRYLEGADSASFFAEAGDALMTGPTGTNVTDIALIMKVSGTGIEDGSSLDKRNHTNSKEGIDTKRQSDVNSLNGE